MVTGTDGKEHPVPLHYRDGEVCAVGYRRQRVGLLGFAGVRNAVTRFLYAESNAPPVDIAA